MLRVAAGCLALGVGSEIFAFAAQASAPIALFLGFVSLTLSLILIVLGLPWTRNLVR